MRIVFLADLHIKLGQKNIPKEWALNRYNLLFRKLYSIVRDYDVHAIVYGGDIFDKVPTIPELEIFYQLLDSFKDLVPQTIFSGNHEATSKHGTFFTHLKGSVKPFNTTIVDEFTKNYFPTIDILPYNELKKTHWHGESNKILLTHVRGSIPPHVKPEIDLELLSGWDIVLAGDLHARSNSQLNIFYPGSPITTSFHREVSNGENGIYILDTTLEALQFIDLNLPQLIRKTVDKEEDMVPTDYHHTIYELVGDLTDLKKVENSILLDKKITKTISKATLNLKDLTIEEELFEYLIEVLGVDDPQAIINEYNDSIKGVDVG